MSPGARPVDGARGGSSAFCRQSLPRHQSARNSVVARYPLHAPFSVAGDIYELPCTTRYIHRTGIALVTHASRQGLGAVRGPALYGPWSSSRGMHARMAAPLSLLPEDLFVSLLIYYPAFLSCCFLSELTGNTSPHVYAC